MFDIFSLFFTFLKVSTQFIIRSLAISMGNILHQKLEFQKVCLQEQIAKTSQKYPKFEVSTHAITSHNGLQTHVCHDFKVKLLGKPHENL